MFVPVGERRLWSVREGQGNLGRKGVSKKSNRELSCPIVQTLRPSLPLPSDSTQTHLAGGLAS